MPLPLGDGDDNSFMSDVSDVNADELQKMIAVSKKINLEKVSRSYHKRIKIFREKYIRTMCCRNFHGLIYECHLKNCDP